MTSKKNKKNALQNTSVETIKSEAEECKKTWLLEGPPFDPLDYMISPSESSFGLCDKKSTHSITKKGEKFSNYKLDEKYVLEGQKILKKVIELIKDGIGETYVSRIKNLIYKYLCETSVGFFVDDLPLIIELIEYFARNRASVPEYTNFVLCFLSYAAEPPKVKKTSDLLLCKSSIIDYFTLLGELLATFQNEHVEMKLLKIIDGLITRKKLVDVSCVKLSICHEAIEESLLPYVIASLLETASYKLYPHYLDLTLQLTMVSLKIGILMSKSNVLSIICWRYDPFFSEKKGIAKTSAEVFESHDLKEDYYKMLDKGGYLIWGLLAIISKEKDDVPCPEKRALWSLKNIFMREIRKKTSKSIDIRNNIAGMILKMLTLFGDELPLVQTGLTPVIVKLSIYNEVTFPEYCDKFKSTTTSQDFILKKIMLLSCCLLVKCPTSIQFLKKEKVLEGILELCDKKITLSWSPSQFLTLYLIALRTLTELISVLAEDFVKCNGTIRLLEGIKWLMDDHFDQNLLHEALKILCVGVTCQNNKCVIDDMKTHNGVVYMMDLCIYLLDKKYMKLEHQEKLSKIFVILEKLFINDPNYQNEFSESCVKVSLKLLKRILANLKDDSKWDPKLLLSFGGFFWEAVAWCPKAVTLFIKKGGIFLILDFIEFVPLPVQMLFLGILVDISDEGETIAHLCTWRGKNGNGVLSLMIDIWQKEESENKVQRTKNGVISDIEIPLMTEEQWYLTYQVRESHIYSPSIAEMICSARPKIHALYQFLQNRYFTLTQLGEESYHLQLKTLKPAEMVYIPLIEHYLGLKMGEIWYEVFQDVSKSGLLPTSFDGDMLFKLVSEKNEWALRIKTMQEEINLIPQRDGSNEEKDLYKFLKSCWLAGSLEALNELDFVARTSFKWFQNQSKDKQIIDVETSIASLPFSKDIHRTFLQKTNVTCLNADHIWVKSENEIVDYEDLGVVSSESSADNYFEDVGDLN